MPLTYLGLHASHLTLQALLYDLISKNTEGASLSYLQQIARIKGDNTSGNATEMKQYIGYYNY